MNSAVVGGGVIFGRRNKISRLAKERGGVERLENFGAVSVESSFLEVGTANSVKIWSGNSVELREDEVYQEQ